MEGQLRPLGQGLGDIQWELELREQGRDCVDARGGGHRDQRHANNHQVAVHLDGVVLRYIAICFPNSQMSANLLRQAAITEPREKLGPCPELVSKY